MKLVYIFCFIVFLFLFKPVTAQVKNCQAAKLASVNTTTLYYSPDNLRSDTFDIIKYNINLDITDFTNHTIKGNTIVRYAPKINGQTSLPLDLLQLTIDSIKQNNTLLSYSYNDTLLRVQLPVIVNTTDTNNLEVYYHGAPQGDPAGWGGFSFSGNYAYNLGVGFGANPHNYGRVWFPCFDNFVEKSLYEFTIKTSSAKTSYCNGELVLDSVDGSFRFRRWVMNKPIPTYLASVAVADYTQVNWNINAANGNLPIILAARPSDTTALKNGFVHLPNALLGFENYYGPYVWNRVGYCLVPFSSGAMEHATNIAYPQAATNIAYEAQLMAHELSHHWWGDLMTCETQEDMWLNEGMASYSERLFLEWTYSYDKYLNEVKTKHDDIVKYIHLREGGFRAVSGIPHAFTYGDHVYKKGADVAHTLRSYMGDAAFFNGLKYVLQQKAYKNMNSLEFRDLLETSSGQNLHPFFDNWVLNGGWPHFSIDSVVTTGTPPPYTSVVYVKQKLFGAPSLFSNVPLEITFMNASWNKEVKSILMNGATHSFSVQTTILPSYCAMNMDSKISDAISSEFKTIKTNATINYSLAKVNLMVSNKGADSSLIRIEHNIAMPDPIKNNINNYRLNKQHYWKIDGLLSNGFQSKVRFNYDGGKVKSGNSYLDTSLIITNADSLILLYRKNAADDWHEVPHYTKQTFGTKAGVFVVDTLKFGEYVFANGVSGVLTSISNGIKTNSLLKVYPNPTQDELNIEINQSSAIRGQRIEVTDALGKIVFRSNSTQLKNVINVSQWKTGIYQVKLFQEDKPLSTTSFVIER